MKNNSLIAVTWFILSLVISVCNDALTKTLNSSLSPSTIAFWRFIFSTIILLPIIIKFGLSSIKTSKMPFHMLRGLILSTAISLWCYGISFVPIATVTLMSFTVPMFTVLMAGMFLREKITFYTITATCIGFTGSIIALAPHNLIFPITSGIFILASILFATLDILNKMLLNQGENTLPMMFYSNVFSAIFVILLPNSMNDIFSINLIEFGLLMILGLGANLILFCIIKAFAHASASFLAPIRYLELLISALIGFIFFHEKVSYNIVMGGVLVILSSILITKKTIVAVTNE